MTGTLDMRPPKQPLSASAKALAATPLGGAISYLAVWALRDGLGLNVTTEAYAAISIIITSMLVWLVPNIPQPQRNRP